MATSGGPVSEVEFVTPPSQSLLCPVCHDVCHEPLITNVCHHSFCTACIFQTLEQGESACPLCRRHLSDRDLHPNLALSSLIQELLVYCPYRKYGCQAQMRLDARHSHERVCQHAPARCPHFVHGCDFESSEMAVQEHLGECIFEKLRGYISRNERQVQAMKETIQALSKEVEELREQLRRGRAIDVTASSSGDGERAAPPPSPARSAWPHGNLSCQFTLSEQSGVTALARSGDTLYCGGYDGSTKVWDLQTHSLRSTYTGHKSSVWSLVVDAPRDRLFSSSSDGSIKSWSTEPGATTCQQTLSVNRGRIYALLLHGGRLISGSSDKTVRVWDPDTLECLQTLDGHTDGVNSVALYPDGSIISGSNDHTIRIWDAETGACKHVIRTPSSEVLSVAVGDGLLFGAGYDANIVAYDTRSDYSVVGTLTGHKWEVWQLVHVNGALFSGSFDHSVKRWDLRNMSNTATLCGHKGYIHAVIAAGESLITGCAARMVKIWSC